MAIETLPADFILRKHNLELYLTKKIEPKVPFLKIFPLSDNDTGEFTTVLENLTSKEDPKITEPLEMPEGSDITDIQISPLNAVLGKTMAVGYQFQYTDQFLNRQDSPARISAAISKIIAGMVHKVNRVILGGMINAAGKAVPDDISDWATAIDPRSDAIKMRDAFSTNADGDELPFELNKAFIAGTFHSKLQEYYSNMNWPFNNKSMDVDGTYFDNVKNALNDFADVDFVGIDDTVPAGIIEKYVNPKYSTIKKAELQNEQKDMDIPDSLINVNYVKPRYIQEPHVYQIFAELGYNSLEPDGVMTGKLSP